MGINLKNEGDLRNIMEVGSGCAVYKIVQTAPSVSVIYLTALFVLLSTLYSEGVQSASLKGVTF